MSPIVSPRPAIAWACATSSSPPSPATTCPTAARALPPVRACRAQRTAATIEVLTPDFDARPEAIDVVLQARPEVFNHNMETVARLQQHVRRKSQYAVSLAVLEYAKKARSHGIRTKSGLMLGLGETIEELFETLADLRSIGCDFLTLGQYLQPSPKHLPVVRYVPPDEFDELGRLALKLGFADVASGPFVRSSYHADEMASSQSVVSGPLSVAETRAPAGSATDI